MVESDSDEDSVHSPSLSSFQITSTFGEPPQPLRVVIPVDKDPMYAPCASEPLCRWSVPVMEQFVQKEDFDLIIIGESSSSKRCLPLPSEERSASPPYSHCMEEALAASEAPPRPFVPLERPAHEDSIAPEPTPSSFRPWRYPARWNERDDDRDGEDYSESEQLQALANISVWPLYKE